MQGKKEGFQRLLLYKNRSIYSVDYRSAASVTPYRVEAIISGATTL